MCGVLVLDFWILNFQILRFLEFCVLDLEIWTLWVFACDFKLCLRTCTGTCTECKQEPTLDQQKTAFVSKFPVFRRGLRVVGGLRMYMRVCNIYIYKSYFGMLMIHCWGVFNVRGKGFIVVV